MRDELNLDWPPIEFTRAADGSRVSYRHFQGTGTPFLSVHNPGAATLSLTSRIVPREGYDRFRRGRSLILFDWRGSGESGPIQGDLTIEQLGSDLDAIIDIVGGPVDAVLQGRASFAVSLHAARRPERYRSITFGAGMVRSVESFAGFYNRAGWQNNYSEHLRGLAEHSFRLEPDEAVRFALHWERAVPSKSFAAYLDSERDLDLTDVLPRIKVPTWVTAHLPIDNEAANKIALLVPDSRLSIYPVSAGSPPYGGWSRDQWDKHLGSVLGDPPSTPTSRRSDLQAALLSPSELEVLQLVAAGNTNQSVADALSRSVHTVHRHMSSILRKLDATNRTQAVDRARDRGLLP